MALVKRTGLEYKTARPYDVRGIAPTIMSLDGSMTASDETADPNNKQIKTFESGT